MRGIFGAVGDERMTIPDVLSEEIVRRRSAGAATVVRSDRQRTAGEAAGWHLRMTIPDLLSEEIGERRAGRHSTGDNTRRYCLKKLTNGEGRKN